MDADEKEKGAMTIQRDEMWSLLPGYLICFLSPSAGPAHSFFL
ncbi:Uncharacterized protein dnm_034190 [Desulfonema magnum]|uniref:Uncharacterized protein n=1 Tax=Desulfonema magnum TaxID=45655 RepID=A0A975GMX0_9BACT|nr:Uncharacterized protein dnm_034190 [Desulfonema magnum]